jgi:glyoxalase family protein
MGSGQTHHFAPRVADETTQLEWRQTLVDAGLRVSPVMDRVYFKSIYSSDPDGHIVEIATDTPGFMADGEDEITLGQNLMLPPWLEDYREQIEARLTPITVPAWKEVTRDG